MLYSLALQPFSGDLTRLGGFSEADFGWNEPQHAFPRPMYRFGMTPAVIGNEDWDVLVFGDSFSVPHADRATWVDYLVAASGLKTAVVHSRYPSPLLDYLQSASFRTHPPKVIIFEVVTRNLGDIGMAVEDCRPVVPSQVALTWQPTGLAPDKAFARPVQFETLGDRFGTSVFTVRQRVINAALPRLAAALSVQMDRRDLFSSHRSDELIFLPNDRAAATVPADVTDRVSCFLTGIARTVEANGRTRFIFMPAIDKWAAYSPYFDTKKPAIPSTLVRLRTSEFASHMVDPSPEIAAVISEGGRDIYLPNDTHWGAAGAAIVGEVLVQALQPVKPKSAVAGH